MQLAYVSQNAVEHVGDRLGLFSSRMEEDLERFKEFIESWGWTTCPPIMR